MSIELAAPDTTAEPESPQSCSPKPCMSHSGGMRAARKTQRKLKVAALAAGLPQHELAKTLGVSTRTVQRDYAEVMESFGDRKDLLEQLRTLIREHVPHVHRARRLRELVDQSEQPMVALKAIEACNAVEGLSAAAKEAEAPQYQPLFQLPPGTRIAVKVDRE